MSGDGLYEGLFCEAQRESAAAAARGAAAEEERRRAWATRVIAAQARLSASIKESLPGIVRAAAAEGERAAKLLEFAGTDTYKSSSSPEDASSVDVEDFCYLFLLKGPHVANRAQRDDFQAAGGVPLLPYLRSALRPFRLRHVWDRSTNNNVLLAEW